MPRAVSGGVEQRFSNQGLQHPAVCCRGGAESTPAPVGTELPLSLGWGLLPWAVPGGGSVGGAVAPGSRG